jgi:hypothetical protein
LDEHIERQRGAKIVAKGIHRDAVRSSKSFFVKTSGLRRVSMMLLASILWADREADRGMIRVALATGSHLRRSPRTPGHETQRQWSNAADDSGVAGLCLLVTLFAHQVLCEQALPARRRGASNRRRPFPIPEG